MREKTYEEVCVYLENATPNEIFKYFETENKIRFYLKDPIILKNDKYKSFYKEWYPWNFECFPSRITDPTWNKRI